MSALRTQLSWTHYKVLLGVEGQHRRALYSAETVKNNWSSRQLERQIHSNLYERLLLSNDKDSVLAVANKEQQPTDAKQIIKDPMYLEFLGLKTESAYDLLWNLIPADTSLIAANAISTLLWGVILICIAICNCSA